MNSVGNFAAEAFLTKGIPWLAKKGFEQGKYYASEAMRDPELHLIKYGTKQIQPLIQNIGKQALNQLSTKEFQI